MRQWLRVVVPYESFWAILAGLMALLTLTEWIVWKLCHGPLVSSFDTLEPLEMYRMLQTPVGTVGMIVLGFTSAVYAVMRLFSAHPGASSNLKDFLKQTPWQYGRRLPWSSPRLLVQDCVVLTMLLALVYWESRNMDDLPFLARPAIVLTTFAYVRGAVVCLLSFAAAPWCTWGMIYLFPVVVAALQLVGVQLLSPGVLLLLSVMHLVLQEAVIESSLRQVSEQLFDTAPTQNAAEQEPASFLAPMASAGHKVIGAPWNLLSPKWRHGMGVTRREGWLTAVFSGWLVFLVGATAMLMGDSAELYVLIAYAVIVGSSYLAAFRLAVYYVGWTSPLKRFALGQWLIPREDRALIAPLIIAVVDTALICFMFVDAQYHFIPFEGYFRIFPLWASTSVAIALLMGPDLTEHKLTATISIRLNRNGNPKPRR